MAIGTNEMGLTDCYEKNEINEIIVSNAIELDSLIKVQAPESKTLLLIDSCGIHNEKDWARRLPYALEFVLNKK